MRVKTADSKCDFSNMLTLIRNPLTIGSTNRALADATAKNLEKFKPVVNIGGDHSMAIGSIAGTFKYLKKVRFFSKFKNLKREIRAFIFSHWGNGWGLISRFEFFQVLRSAGDLNISFNFILYSPKPTAETCSW